MSAANANGFSPDRGSPGKKKADHKPEVDISLNERAANNMKFGKGKKKDDQEHHPIPNSEIVAKLVLMIGELTFVKIEDGSGFKIIGDHSEESFLSDAIQIIRFEEIPFLMSSHFKDAEREMHSRPVKAIYYLLRAQAVVNFCKALDCTQDYFEYLVVVSNNLAYAFLVFGLGDHRIEQIKNAVGYLVSFMTKDRVLQEIAAARGGNRELVKKGRKVVQRILLTRLYLRQSFALHTEGNNAEALESSRQAFYESCLIALDTVQLALMLLKKIEQIKKRHLLSQWNSVQDPGLLSPHDKQQLEGELKALKRIARSSDGVNPRLPPKSGAAQAQAQQPAALDKKQQAVLEHLRHFVPIALELKKYIESVSETMRTHKKVRRVEQLLEEVRGVPLYPLNLAYLYDNLSEEHFVFRANINEFLNLDLLSLRDVDFEVDLDAVLYQVSSQSLVEKISWLTISLYSMGVEKNEVEEALDHKAAQGHSNFQLRWMKRESMHEGRVPDSQVDLGKALELAYLFLPQKIAWVRHIFKIYETKKAIDSMVIPEEGEVNDRYRYIKPLKGGYKTQLIIPMVRENGVELRNPKYSRDKQRDKGKSLVLPPGRAPARNALSALTTSFGQPSRSGKRLHANSRAFNLMDMTFLGKKPKASKPSAELFKDDLIVDATARRPDASAPWVRHDPSSGQKKLLPAVAPAPRQQQLRATRGQLPSEKSAAEQKSR